MIDIYWVQEWSQVRQKELVRYPKEFKVDDYYTKKISKEDLMIAFEDIWNLYFNIYGEITTHPKIFAMPLHKQDDFNSFTRQARESRSAPYRPFYLLYYLLLSGEEMNSGFIVDINKYKSMSTIKNAQYIFSALADYGFLFEGLKNNKLSKQDISIDYPDNKNVIKVLKLMAEKAKSIDRPSDFLCCHYKLFQDSMSISEYGNGADLVADKMHTDEEKDIIIQMDSLLQEKGYFSKEKSWNEGQGYAYYDKENTMNKNGPYLYWLLSWKTKLVLYLRIRNASKCIEYISKCPESVKDIFRKSDKGCEKHIVGTCQFGQEYIFENVKHWKCGCCNAPYYFAPQKKDIPHYIKLVDIGFKK